MVRRAAERLIDIIGEAAGAVSTEVAQTYPDRPLARTKSMRNLLSHEYWLSDPDIIWDTIKHDIPAFASQLERVREELGLHL